MIRGGVRQGPEKQGVMILSVEQSGVCTFALSWHTTPPRWKCLLTIVSYHICGLQKTLAVNDTGMDWSQDGNAAMRV